MWPTKSPESCRCSARPSVDSLDVSSEARQFSLLSSPPAPFWSHSGDGSHPASFLSALSLQCCQSLSFLLTHPRISGTWTHVKPALCKPGEKEVATIFEPFIPWARPTQDTPAPPPRHASLLGLTPPPGTVFPPWTCSSPVLAPPLEEPARRAAPPQDTPRP